MNHLKRLILLFLSIFAGVNALAQFEVGGGDPGRYRWSEYDTENYRIIYPGRTIQSNLYLEYARELEAVRPVVGKSAGYTPGVFHWGKLPVILHQAYPYSNGMVAWAPKRMDIYTHPDPYGSIPQPWSQQLAIHESRHVAQMQQAYDGILKFGNYLFGESWVGVVSALYPNRVLLEGDAVVAETALSETGRGRNSDFLNYFHLAFDRGDFRDYYKWQYGSFKKYAPDYYAVGYLTVGGLRAFYDQPLFMANYLQGTARKPFGLFNLQREAGNASGKTFKATFREIEKGFHDIWKAEDEARFPFMPSERVSSPTDFATDYTCSIFAEGKHILFKEGKTRSKRLILMDENGRETDLGPFADHTSSLFYDPETKRIYWSETVGDLRWNLGGKSIIRYLSVDDFIPHDLTKEGLLYNPQPSPDGNALSVIEYPVEGGSSLVIIDAKSGHRVLSVPAPEGVQLTESAWFGEDLYFLGLDNGGFGLWKYDGDSWSIASPSSSKATCNLGSGDDYIEYVADLNGYNELYFFYPESGETRRMTNLHYGGTDFAVSDDDVLYYSSMTESGMGIFRTPMKELSPVGVNPEAVHYYPVAEKLSAQERALGAILPTPLEVDIPSASPKPYSKLSHIARFHSWLPLYADYEAISSLTMDISYEEASIGATAFFQNDLGTSSGSVGYSLHKDPYNNKKWKNSLHGKITYTGLYPVIEASVDVNSRSVLRYHYNETLTGKDKDQFNSAIPLGGNSLSGSLSAYVPMNFSKGGVLRGLVPKVSFGLSNDKYDTGVIRRDRPVSIISPSKVSFFSGYTPGELTGLGSVTLSLRGYSMLARADSETYPRYGIGAEAGYVGRLTLGNLFSPEIYTYVYGYLPGFAEAQGWKLTARTRHYTYSEAAFKENRIDICPRGINANIPGNNFFRVTADYALPLYFGDISALSPIAYINHFLMIPHFDLTGFGRGFLFTLGCDFSVELSNLLWFPFDGSVGFSVDLNGGSYFKEIKETNDRLSFGLIFSMDI